ncbi:hypothetical protein B296_00002142 [Ensete ventricosum]|uniref:Uncharacterized protein n=1 Tax=Ensete ventricosum TaxID=4639 RepID=A0A427AWQ8_ENSVE|nr:hypothetical protein B296_00002142 [Ensete ventricosum]
MRSATSPPSTAPSCSSRSARSTSRWPPPPLQPRRSSRTRTSTFASRPQIASGYLCSGIAFCPFGPYWKQLHKLCFMELLSTSRHAVLRLHREGGDPPPDERHLDEFRADRRDEREALHANDEQDCVPGGVRPEERALGAIPCAIREALDLVLGFYFADVFPSLSFLDYLTGANFKLRVSVDFQGVPVFQYLPFWWGAEDVPPRAAFALATLATVELTLAQLLLCFDWELPEGMKPEELDMSESFGLVAAWKTELKLLATPRVPLPSAV